MIPALVLLLVYNLCCARVYAFDPERKDGIIGHDLLLDLLKRLDAKDDEIKELRGIQMRQEANINKLMMQIGEHDVNINELRKKLNEKDNAISEIDQNQKHNDKMLNELQYNVEKLQIENDQLRKYYPKCERRIQSLQAVMKKYMQRNKISQLVRQHKNPYYVDDKANPIGDTVERGLNKSTSAITVSLNRRDSDKKNRDDRRHAGTDIVAFFASLTNNLQNLGVGENVKFDHVITNIGAAYNPHAGAFFAPVSGTYVFMSTLLAYYGHNGHFQVVHNGNMVCNLYVAGAAGITHDTSAGSFVLYLEKVDMVTIQNSDSGEWLSGSHYSFFSGFLLKEMEHNPSVVG
ncbi:putative leucine-rich repeat-containing protein DDB_G0290503 isoform X3 [Dreissena polymorpha]|uniref:putative leucine-rich repeat-containing protein DDB_G0290503 isoform X3 n=1 Tax=Dreissena polymorpha TaxID=45954 RepID=UPI00226543C7|nr:putative leucine-rich repeat-containing protein DDB_G0290503 isoform X3 [Dreissena polymorpha]